MPSTKPVDVKKSTTKPKKKKGIDALVAVLEANQKAKERQAEKEDGWDKVSACQLALHSETILSFDFKADQYESTFGHFRTFLFNYYRKKAKGIHSSSFLIHIGVLAQYWEDFVEEWMEDEDFVPDQKSIESFVLNYRKVRAKHLEETIGNGRIEFVDLPLYFQIGDQLISSVSGEALGGEYLDGKFTESFFGDYFTITLRVITNLYSRPTLSKIDVTIPAYTGTALIAELPVRKITTDEMAQLSTRGKLYRELTTGPTHAYYDGQLVRSSWHGLQSFRSTGRVMIDSGTFAQMDADQFRAERSSAGIGRLGLEPECPTIADADLYRTYPFLYGFSFAAKKWGRMAVSKLSHIKWRDDAFDYLVLEEDRKQLVQALVRSHTGTFSDIIDGKGGGVIFLLSGPPGQGKTLTAETVSEELRRPLYSISVGELGTNPDTLETRLAQILDVATIWNAVLLLDEADIFLAQRNTTDIVRNAMVGVFLRLLEYHQGVLFLTSNLGDSIDRAFMSRISVILDFKAMDESTRSKVWHNLLAAAGLSSGGAAEYLAQYDLNGRQIKNVIRTTQALAKDQGVPVTLLLMADMAERTHQITQDKVSFATPQKKQSLWRRIRG